MSSEFDTLTKYILMIFKYYQHSEKLKIICIIFQSWDKSASIFYTIIHSHKAHDR